jgi:hypothetical protein
VRTTPGWPSLALLALAGAVAVPGAGAAPSDDLFAVFSDWRRDGDVTACRFSRAQLVSARSRITPDVDAYAPSLREEVNREIARWDAGGCGRGGDASRSVPLLARLRIVRIRPRGRRTESVTIKNTGRRTANLRRASLRDRAGHRIRFRRRLRLRGGSSLRVVTGCPRGRRRAFRRRSRYFACRRSQLWNARGDVARLYNSRGRIVSQRGYGRFRRARRF